MLRQIAFMPFITGLLFFTTSAVAETPNLQPGLWSHTSTSSIEGPMTIPSQATTNQECLTQADLDKGIDVLNIPKECTVTQADIRSDRVDYAASCNMQGVSTVFKGFATFHGTRIEGKMTSDMDTPLGKMLMKTDYSGERIGDC